MKLYKGSKIKADAFPLQPLHHSDIEKFPPPTPEGVIFATESEIVAKIFCVFGKNVPFYLNSLSKSANLKVTLLNPLNEQTLSDTVFIYEFDSEDGNWQELKGSGEWYSTEPQIPERITEYSRSELYEEIKNNPEVKIVEEYSTEQLTEINGNIEIEQAS